MIGIFNKKSSLHKYCERQVSAEIAADLLGPEPSQKSIHMSTAVLLLSYARLLYDSINKEKSSRALARKSGFDRIVMEGALFIWWQTKPKTDDEFQKVGIACDDDERASFFNLSIDTVLDIIKLHWPGCPAASSIKWNRFLPYSKAGPEAAGYLARAIGASGQSVVEDVPIYTSLSIYAQVYLPAFEKSARYLARTAAQGVS